jgi:maltose alpha-D-glucosyltransferase/alpha-amylase
MAWSPLATTLLETIPERVLCRLQKPDGDGVLYDGVADDSVCVALLAAIESANKFNSRRGTIRAWPSRVFRQLRGAAGDVPAVKRGSADQSYTSIFYGGRLMLKLYRRLESGINPDQEIGRYLTEEVGFDRILPFAGAIEYVTGTGETQTVALLQAAVENQGDGWHWILEELGRYYERCAAFVEQTLTHASAGPDGAPPGSGIVSEAMGLSLETAATLGRRTAELHKALSAGSGDPAFTPEPLNVNDVTRVLDSVRNDARKTLDLLEQNIHRLPSDVAAEAEIVAGRKTEIMLHLDQLQSVNIHATRIRIHGDYHLGRVLRAQNDYLIIDFEGEPVRPLSERRAKTSPLKDVAGMIRSFGYAAFAGLSHHSSRRPGEFARFLDFGRAWEKQMASVFLTAYRTTANDADFLPSDLGEFEALLNMFLMERAFYELRYELNNRPAWVRIPIQGIYDLIATHS